MNVKRLVLLASPGEATNISFNALQSFFPPMAVVLEQPLPRTQFLKKTSSKAGLGHSRRATALPGDDPALAAKNRSYKENQNPP